MSDASYNFSIPQHDVLFTTGETVAVIAGPRAVDDGDDRSAELDHIAYSRSDGLIEVRRFPDGQLITGVMANQSATAVTLRRRKGEQDTVLRSNIAELRALSVSAMPENLEESINLQQMSDLLEFLKSLGTVKNASATANVRAN